VIISGSISTSSPPSGRRRPSSTDGAAIARRRGTVAAVFATRQGFRFTKTVWNSSLQRLKAASYWSGGTAWSM
jgi:hypothetical protein